jgi:16S rRNA (adenine1518-N6/adenine1519-N6)-dimethyltransferase
MTKNRRPGFDELRARLRSTGFRPSSSRGQNFLVDRNLLEAIARDAEIAPRDTVLEIGSGPGGLTTILGSLASRVVAFEIEPRLAALAREATAAIPGVEIVVGDALGGRSKHGLHPRIEECLAAAESPLVVANLPYSIAAPLLANLFERERPPRRAIVMIQREVADRLLAEAGTREYGALTVALRAGAAIERVREVPREVFRPRPKVASAVVRLTPLADRLDPGARVRLRELLAIAFGERRKQLVPRLAPYLGGAERAAAALASLGHPPNVRGESLSVDDFRFLARARASSP